MCAMDAKVVKEMTVYLYELTQSRFKEINATLKFYDNGKAVAFRGDNDKDVFVASKEGKLYKDRYIWFFHKNKEEAAKIFNIKIKMDLIKQQEALDITNDKIKILDKFLNTKKK